MDGGSPASAAGLGCFGEGCEMLNTLKRKGFDCGLFFLTIGNVLAQISKLLWIWKTKLFEILAVIAAVFPPCLIEAATIKLADIGAENKNSLMMPLECRGEKGAGCTNAIAWGLECCKNWSESSTKRGRRVGDTGPAVVAPYQVSAKGGGKNSTGDDNEMFVEIIEQ